jgi:hypothetical protein
LCSVCFGCCLARTRNIQQIVLCFEEYLRCLGDCFRPLTRAITQPAAGVCAVEQYYIGPKVYGIEIVGTATGAFCDHYVLELKDALAPPAAYTQAFFVYAPPAPPAGPGACGIVGGPLGYLQTFGNPVPTDIEVRLTVFSSQQGQAPCVVEVSFQIFEARVSIENVQGIQVQSPPGWPDPNAPHFNTAINQVASFGTDVEIFGHAWVGTCAGRTTKRYTLCYQPGFVNDPNVGPWTQFWQVDYNSAKQQAAIATGYIDLTSRWILNKFCPQGDWHVGWASRLLRPWPYSAGRGARCPRGLTSPVRDLRQRRGQNRRRHLRKCFAAAEAAPPLHLCHAVARYK